LNGIGKRMDITHSKLSLKYFVACNTGRFLLLLSLNKVNDNVHRYNSHYLSYSVQSNKRTCKSKSSITSHFLGLNPVLVWKIVLIINYDQWEKENPYHCFSPFKGKTPWVLMRDAKTNTHTEHPIFGRAVSENLVHYSSHYLL
jgi:hypothetical protein